MIWPLLPSFTIPQAFWLSTHVLFSHQPTNGPNNALYYCHLLHLLFLLLGICTSTSPPILIYLEYPSFLTTDILRSRTFPWFFAPKSSTCPCTTALPGICLTYQTAQWLPVWSVNFWQARTVLDLCSPAPSPIQKRTKNNTIHSRKVYTA